MTISLACAACGIAFEFSAEEQEFYQSKGFQPPKKCKPCRDAAKQERNGYASNDRSSTQKTMHDTVCTACGVQTQVPFKPNGSKPVYCRSCFQNNSSY